MLAHDRVEFTQFELFSLGAWILFRDVVVARIGAANHFDKNRAWFRHGRNPRVVSLTQGGQIIVSWFQVKSIPTIFVAVRPDA